MTDYRIEPGSFRDSNGRVFYCKGNVYRGLSQKAFYDWGKLSSTNLFSRFLAAGKLVGTAQVDPTDEGIPPEIIQGWAAVLKHQTIPFVSYPYEWSFNMLKNAAMLHLELLLAALAEDMILKDSSPFNIQWLGTKPVFIDIPSFEILQPGEPWVGFRQFCQLFLYPLFLQAYKDVAFHPWLRGSINGISPEQFNNLMSMKDLLRPGIFSNVFLQAKIQKHYGSVNRDIKGELQKACFNKKLIEANVLRIQKLVLGLEWKRSNSEWSNYANTHSYSDSDNCRKTNFVREIVALRRWSLVWDVGCNTGKFSKIAAENADCVIAIDSDHLAIDHLYRSLNEDGTKHILPLVANIADASPNLGWRGQERKALARRGKPELTLCLALIHHIVIGENIPLKEFVEWLASLHTSLVIEFVTQEDVMVKKLCCNKEGNHDEYSVEYFENCLINFFAIRRSEILGSGTRILYFAERLID